MNMSTTKRYQDILQELSKTPREDVVKFRNKYEEALNEFLELKEVYTIASKKSSLEEIKNNTAKPLCALNHKKLPTIWFFSEREFAQDFVNHFRLIKDEVEYIRVLKGEEIIEAIKYGVFNGIYQFSIDEGKCTMVMVPYDLLNIHFNKVGKENFLEKNQYELMILFTMMKFYGKVIYAIESDELNDNGNYKLAYDRSGIINLFENKDDANTHKYDIGYGRKEVKALNIIEFRNIINSIENEKENIKIEIKENVFEINIKKLKYILNEMIEKKKKKLSIIIR